MFPVAAIAEAMEGFMNPPLHLAGSPARRPVAVAVMAVKVPAMEHLTAVLRMVIRPVRIFSGAEAVAGITSQAGPVEGVWQ